MDPLNDRLEEFTKDPEYLDYVGNLMSGLHSKILCESKEREDTLAEDGLPAISLHLKEKATRIHSWSMGKDSTKKIEDELADGVVYAMHAYIYFRMLYGSQTE